MLVCVCVLQRQGFQSLLFYFFFSIFSFLYAPLVYFYILLFLFSTLYQLSSAISIFLREAIPFILPLHILFKWCSLFSSFNYICIYYPFSIPLFSTFFVDYRCFYGTTFYTFSLFMLNFFIFFVTFILKNSNFPREIRDMDLGSVPLPCVYLETKYFTI